MFDGRFSVTVDCFNFLASFYCLTVKKWWFFIYFFSIYIKYPNKKFEKLSSWIKFSFFFSFLFQISSPLGLPSSFKVQSFQVTNDERQKRIKRKWFKFCTFFFANTINFLEVFYLMYKWKIKYLFKKKTYLVIGISFFVHYQKKKQIRKNPVVLFFFFVFILKCNYCNEKKDSINLVFFFFANLRSKFQFSKRKRAILNNSVL